MTVLARKAIGYARLSKDSGRTGEGVDRQLEDVRKLAELRGFELIAEEVDNDTSAAGGKLRPGFERVLAALQDGTADVVIAWAWDRLSRNRRDEVRLIEIGREAKALISLVRGSGDLDMANANGRFVADMLASMSRQEIDNKAERQARAGQQRAEQGKPPSRRAFGYQQDGTPHPVEGPIVVELFTLYLAGATIVGLQKWLNEHGHKTTRGKRWDDTGVRQLLLNPRYIAERHYRGERIAAGTWPALVSAETFAAVQSRLNDPARKKARPARKYLGSGLFLCWCGSLTSSGYANGGRVYVCRAQKHMQRVADPVDDVVRDVIARRLRRPDLADLLAADKSAGVASELRAEATGYRARLDTLAADYAEGLLTGSQVRVATERITGKLSEVEAKLAEVGRGSALATVSGADDPGAAWLALPLDRQRAVLADLATVTILKGKVGRGSFDRNTVRIEWVTA